MEFIGGYLPTLQAYAVHGDPEMEMSRYSLNRLPEKSKKNLEESKYREPASSMNR